MIQELNFGEVVEFVEFSYKKKNGGTAIAKQIIDIPSVDMNIVGIRLDGIVRGTVIKRWDDDECGERAWVQLNTGHKNYLRQDGNSIHLDIVYIGEFDLVRHNKLLVNNIKKNLKIERKIEVLYDSVGEGFQELDKKYRHYPLKFDHVNKKVVIMGNDNSAKSVRDYLGDKLCDEKIRYTAFIKGA